MTITIAKKRKHSAVFIILMFYLLFAPPIMGIHSLYFVAAFSWGYLIWNNRLLFQTIHAYNLEKLYFFLSMLFVWAVALVVLNSGTRAVIYHYLYWLVAVFPGALAVGLHTKKHGETVEYLFRLILWAALIQSLFSVAAFADNNIKLMLIEKLEADETIVMSSYTYEIYYRLFGFAAGLTFDMPSAMAMIACIALYLAIKKDIRYILFVPTIVFSAVINARTSVVIIAIGVLLMCVMDKKFSSKGLVRLTMIAVVGIAAIVIGISVLQQVSPLTFGWVEAGIGQLLGFFQRDTSSGYFEYLADPERWTLPTGISLLFGTGSRVMGGSAYGVFSDVGYINDIWFGGILYLVALYSLAGKMIRELLKWNRKSLKQSSIRFVALAYMICMPILNVKTYVISMGSLTTVFIILYVYSVLYNHGDGIEELNGEDADIRNHSGV